MGLNQVGYRNMGGNGAEERSIREPKHEGKRLDQGGYRYMEGNLKEVKSGAGIWE